jgi:hypothetical protein
VIGHFPVVLDMVVLFAEVVCGRVEERRRRVRCPRCKGKARGGLRVVRVRHVATLEIGLGGARRRALAVGGVAVEGGFGLATQRQPRLRLGEELGGI